jgi:ribosome biogenesis GTPase A
MKKLFTSCCLLLVLVLHADTFDEVIAAIKTSNTKDIAKHFNNNVELTVLNKEGVYSKQQAEIILKNFFAENPPKNVTLQHKGSSAQGSRYAIAIYESTQSKYRVYIFMKETGGYASIHELRFEKE